MLPVCRPNRGSYVVGYCTKDVDSAEVTYFSGGKMFNVIGAKGTWQLKDIKAVGMDTTADFIQFLDSEAADTYLSATCADDTYAEKFRGWWDGDDVGGTRVDEEEFDNGTAFLGAFTSGNTITFTYAGEVQGSEGATITIPEDCTYAFICNPLPVDVQLGDLTCDGMDTTADFLQFLDTEYADTYLSVTFADSTYAAKFQGWWDGDDVGGTRVDDQPLLAGEGILGAFTSGQELELVFPDPLTVKHDAE